MKIKFLYMECFDECLANNKCYKLLLVLVLVLLLLCATRF